MSNKDPQHQFWGLTHTFSPSCNKAGKVFAPTPPPAAKGKKMYYRCAYML